MATIYDFKAVAGNGKEIDFRQFEGKVLLIVNTASKCGFTPQFDGLEALNKKYRDRGLVCIGFPCNQFKEQDPGSDSEILARIAPKRLPLRNTTSRPVFQSVATAH